MSELTDRPEIQSIVFTAIEHAIESLAHEGGPLTPFVIVAEDEKATLHRFAAGTLEEGQAYARSFIRRTGPQATMVALAYDGFLTVDDIRTDAVFVAAQAAGTTTSDLFAQCYEPRDGTIVEIGNARHVAVDEPSLLAAQESAPSAKKSTSVLARLRGGRRSVA